MSRETRLKFALAGFGLAFATALFTYLEFTNYARLSAVWLGISILFCPPSLLSVLFLDVEPHTVEAVLVWSVIGLLNGGLYSVLGMKIAKYVWKRGRPSASSS